LTVQPVTQAALRQGFLIGRGASIVSDRPTNPGARQISQGRMMFRQRQHLSAESNFERLGRRPVEASWERSAQPVDNKMGIFMHDRVDLAGSFLDASLLATT
jgi:hypothetical protein